MSIMEMALLMVKSIFMYILRARVLDRGNYSCGETVSLCIRGVKKKKKKMTRSEDHFDQTSSR